MWCEKCEAEVAAEVSRGGRIQCASCSSDIAPSRSLRTTSRTQEARDLLQRWSQQPPLDPFGPLIGDKSTTNEPRPQPLSATPALQTTASVPQEDIGQTESTPTATEPVVRTNPISVETAPAVVHAHQPPEAPPPPQASPVREPLVREPIVEQPRPIPQQYVPEPPAVHAAHREPAPHFDVQSFVAESGSKSNFVALAGQLLAYAGVALLTVGTVLVLWGHFGGPQGYTATGWLVSTAGQMMLFLGIITLVSGGMEHTAEQMRSEIRMLGDKLVRIEQASRDHALKGPSIRAEQFAADRPQPPVPTAASAPHSTAQHHAQGSY